MSEYLDLSLPIVEKDPDTGEYKATPYFEDYLHSLVVSTGGEGSTTVNEVLASSLNSDKVPFLTGLILSIKSKVSSLEAGMLQVDKVASLTGLVLSLRKKIGHLEAALSTHIVEAAVKQLQIDTARFNTKIKAVNYTAKNKDYIEGRGNITLKFPSSAVSGDEVIFSNGNGSTITIDGNGNNIKYTSTDTTLVMRNEGTSLHFHFFEDNVLNERYWRAR